jgi:hypothetical protein
MARYNHNVYASVKSPRYVVLFDLQWQILECQRLEPSTDLGNAMITATQRLAEGGWQCEGEIKFGFVFLNRHGVRRLLVLTERDPYDNRPQTFSPFK